MKDKENKFVDSWAEGAHKADLVNSNAIKEQKTKEKKKSKEQNKIKRSKNFSTIKEKIKKILKFEWMSKKFWLRIFLFQICIIVSLKICGVHYMSDAMTMGSMGFIAALIGFYSYKKGNEIEN